MSELTQCNFCSLRKIKRRATGEGKTVTLRQSSEGIKVFVHRKDEDLLPWNDDTPPEKSNQVSEFYGLSGGCVC